MNKKKKAVALRYEKGKNNAPEVVAKGKGSVAERIIQIAKEHNVHIQKDPELVEALQKLDIFQEIPPSLYKAVAEILIFLYKNNKKGL